MKAITANLLVESIEASLPFWEGRLGFTRVTEVPEGGALGFVILARGETRLMLQSLASVKGDVPPMATQPSRATLYIDVEDLEAIKRALGDWPRVVPDRTTFYGAREVIVQCPAGNYVFFAQH